MSTLLQHDQAAVFDPYLSHDESILWMGRPNPLWLLGWNDFLAIPFSLLWGGFAIFWESMALGSDAPLIFKLWGLPFVLAGQYMIWGRFIHKYLLRRHTYYAITEHRALVLNTWWGTKLHTYFLDQIVSLHRQGKSVIFKLNEPPPKRKRREEFDWLTEDKLGFHALADADTVYTGMLELIMPEKPKNDWR